MVGYAGSTTICFACWHDLDPIQCQGQGHGAFELPKISEAVHAGGDGLQPPSGAFRFSYISHCLCRRSWICVIVCVGLQDRGLTISSSVWQILVLTSLDLPCGTTRCVVNIQALYLTELLWLYIVMTTHSSSDTTSSRYQLPTFGWTSVSSKCSWKVCEWYLLHKALYALCCRNFVRMFFRLFATAAYLVKPPLHNTTGCTQTGWTTVSTSGWMFVYAIQPFLSRIQSFNRLSSLLFNRLYVFILFGSCNPTSNRSRRVNIQPVIRPVW